MKLTKIALTVTTLLISSGALAHGYIEAPQSRAYKCNLQENSDCGPVQYEPQSVEKDSGFPTGPWPLDGELASGSIANFSPIDKQSSTQWSRNSIKPGVNNFTWNHTAPHKTNNWRYYITKQDWDPNQPLTRSSFEPTPFCQVEGHGEIPEKKVTHKCNVPERSGYQVIYGVWEIFDTQNSFYQIIDVDFGEDEGIISEWVTKLSGQINGKDLKQGDKVIARFFDANGEVLEKRTILEISSPEQTDKNRWSYDLATTINNTYQDLRVGVKDSKGNVAPVHGTNYAFVKKDSRLNRVVISYEEQSPEIKEEVSVSGVQASEIKNGNATVDFNVEVKGEVEFEAKILDHAGSEKGYVKQKITDATKSFTLSLSNVLPGHHMLKYFALNNEGKLVKQEVIDLQLEGSSEGGGEYQFVFPENIDSYTGGTTVLQKKDGKIYECKPFPYSGYCKQWTQNETQYEPGFGTYWQDAWTLKN